MDPAIPITVEIFLLAISLCLGVAALVVSWRRPSELQKQYQNLLELIHATESKLKETERKLGDAETRLDKLATENVRLQAIILLLRIQLREHGVEIERLPEYLREPDKFPGLAISVTEGGIQVSGGEIHARDLVGRDAMREEKG